MAKKKLLAYIMAGMLALASLTGCGSSKDGDKESGKKKVALTVWGAEEDQELLKGMIDSFQKEYADKAKWKITLEVESEKNAKDDVLNDLDMAADVFAFADDQVDDLVKAKALQEITLDTDKVIEENGGPDSLTVQAASHNGKLYGYPMTADNGYFMFYNKEYFSEKDVKSLDAMLKIAAKNNKQVAIEIDNAWYLYSFFAGAGLGLKKNDDGKNFCNWNSTKGKFTGVEVAEAILDITSHKRFVRIPDTEFAQGLKDGTVIAGINGTWQAQAAEKTWGENYGAAKLPTFTCAGKQVQMRSFAGYKLIGINAYSKNKEFALLLGRYLTNYENQVKRFEERGLGPSNVQAAESDQVKANPAINALNEQAPYADAQRIGDRYWDPAQTLGTILIDGNSEGTPLQTLLDTTVEEIVAEN